MDKETRLCHWIIGCIRYFNDTSKKHYHPVHVQTKLNMKVSFDENKQSTAKENPKK